MWEQVEVARNDSDTALFNSLMYLGEMFVKIAASGLVAGVDDDPERQRYRLVHGLVRADGIGDWGKTINDVLTGTSAQNLLLPVRDEQRELIQKLGSGTWQYEAVSHLHLCLQRIDDLIDPLVIKVQALKWFEFFAMLRNKTRGHGAVQISSYEHLCPNLETSLRAITGNFTLIQRPWAYLHRNLSGKYRVISLSSEIKEFDLVKNNQHQLNLLNGVYVWFGKPVRVELIESNVDSIDFFFPNGNFKAKKYEMISYITGDVKEGDTTPYLAPTGELPQSETQGETGLDIQGNCFGNLPPKPEKYVNRPELEKELNTIITNERHPMITLVGRGGIGKTSLALQVLHNVTKCERIGAILWFSSRDVDLLVEGPKLVKANVLNQADIAKEFSVLMQPDGYKAKTFDALDYLAHALQKSPLGDPLLFVFDNFETVSNPVDLYSWVDTYIRLPNKVLITTRLRDFKGDYPVEVQGMNEYEAEELIVSTAKEWGVSNLLTADYKKELFHESDGHPYVIKILLGDVAKANKLVKIEKIVADREGLLSTLFERTFANLSPAAKRVFLTLSNWRSVVPQMAIEAVLLRPDNEKMDVALAIEELVRSSFIEITYSNDEQAFINAPLVASIFGKNKLAVSPMRSAIEADTNLLHAFGASQKSDIKRGVQPRVERMFKQVAGAINRGSEKLEDRLPMIEFIASKYPPTWLLLSRLYEESAFYVDEPKAKEALRRCLEATAIDTEHYAEERKIAWQQLVRLCEKTNDVVGEIHSRLELCKLIGTTYWEISFAANKANSSLSMSVNNWDYEERQVLAKEFIALMQRGIGEADATDYARLAWLCLYARDTDSAIRYTQLGLYKDSSNYHCLNLASRLNIIDAE